MAELRQRVEALEMRNQDLKHQLEASRDNLHALRENGAWLQQLFRHCPVAFVVHDSSSHVISWNHMARKLFGSANDSARISLTRFFHGEELCTWFYHLRRSESSSAPVRTPLTLDVASGGHTPVEAISQRLPGRVSDRDFRLLTLFLDQTAPKAAEAALAQTQENYHRLIDTIEGVVWEADATTLEVLFVSAYAERLLGYSPADWKWPRFWENHIYVEDRERVANQIARAVSRREPLSLDYRVLTAARKVLWLHDSISVVERDGRLVLLGVAVDVTARRQSEEQLRTLNNTLELRVAERTSDLRQSVADLEAFSYSLSHDLRSPIRAMLGFATLAADEGAGQLSPEINRFLSRIMSSAARADRLIQDVLVYSRLSRQSMKLIPVDLERFLPDLIAQYPEFQPPQAQIVLRGPLLPIMAHEACLAQCVSNLLSNAVKFVPKERKPEVEISTELAGGKVRLWCKDNGIGIEPADLNRIFGIFERVYSRDQYEGTGIGLAIVRKAAERLGGTVGVESQPGIGSSFWLNLQPALS